jgi:pSer/pThr/pTyr-binding forkhead associated (FHA) protein
MPVTVVVRSASGGSAPSLTFDGGRVVIGRSDGSDLRLPDPSVSQRHASIRAQGAEYVLVDEGSTNGTWAGGIKLGPHTPRLIKSGDLVRVGRVWLEIVVGQKPPTADLGLATRDLALALVRSAMDAVGDDTAPTVRVVEGPDLGSELRLVDEGRAYVIGRGEKCDLLLSDEDASREHAFVVRRGASVLLRDPGSRNGVFLGDARLPAERDVPWRSTTMARLGVSVLSLEEPVSLALAELEAAADEPIADADAPPPPVSPPPPSSPVPAPEDAPASTEAAPAPSRRGAEAPVADFTSRTAPTVARARPRRAWTGADVAVATIAVAVIGASLAGLFWVLR